MNWSRKTGLLLIAIGAILVAVIIGFRVYHSPGSHQPSVALEKNPPPKLERLPDPGRPTSPDRPTGFDRDAVARPALSSIPSSVDFELWSDKRIAAYKETLTQRFDPPVALLEISKIHLEVPVFNGTDEAILNRGVGRIIGTAHPGGRGNIGIAGHRDGFFRALKDIAIGDAVVLVTTEGKRRYRVNNITIVAPDNVEILRDKSVPTLTLVTCYPFYFHGDAPQRYILQCSLNKGGHALATREPIMAAGSAEN